MAFSLFADESGTHQAAPCYSIGVLAIPDASLAPFERCFADLYRQHGIVGEVRWAKIAKGHGLINFAIDLVRYICESGLSFSAIVVLKSAYRKWQAGPVDEAFYTTYSFLLEHSAQAQPGDYVVFIDDRSESYGKHDEALQIITNRMLDTIATTANIASVKKSDSRLYPGIQAADVLTGAINAAHHLYIDPSCQLSPGKHLALQRLAGTVWLVGLTLRVPQQNPWVKCSLWI